MSLSPRCRTTGEHDWAEGSLSMWCVKCWLVKPYRELRKKGTPKMLTIPPRRVVEQVLPAGTPHWRAWESAEEQPECCYCGERFHEGNPPTWDHVIPLAHGGRKSGEKVLACTKCNGARGCAPYDDYMSAVIEEGLAALAERRSYRRPKTITHADGTQTITTATRRERKLQDAS